MRVKIVFSIVLVLALLAGAARVMAQGPVPSNFWGLTGNRNTNPDTHFLGTTDEQPLEVRVNDGRALRIEPGADSPNLIGGFVENSVADGVDGATIGGGGNSSFPNRVAAPFSTVGGGVGNVAGDQSNPTGSTRATVGGGTGNEASGFASTVGGGQTNIASGGSATIGGGGLNTVNGSASTVGGGFENSISGDNATISGGAGNGATADFATIAGGGRTVADDPDTGNRVTDNHGTVSGGGNNRAGNANDDLADSRFATVGGGEGNTASAFASTVSGGQANSARGDFAMVSGGEDNAAMGDHSFAAGRRAQANHDGTFVWSDATDADFGSTGENQFLIRAAGNVGINTNDPAALLDVAGDLHVDGSASIGTARSQAPLQVHGAVGLESDVSSGSQLWNLHVDADGNLRFNANSAAGGTARMIIDDDGEPYLLLRGGTSSSNTPELRLQQANAGIPDAPKVTFLNPDVDDSNLAALVMRDGSAFTFEYPLSNELMRIDTSGNVGIGRQNPAAKLDVHGWSRATRSINAYASFENHVVSVENISTGGSPDVLALKVGTRGDPGGGVNFITFFNGNDEFLGRIEGDGDGGVSLLAPGGDFAEWLPRLHSDEVMEPGDIVGIVDGGITKATQGAYRIHVVSTAPIVVGNSPAQEDEHLYGKVAFLGQVPVKVRGGVQAGDYVVPAGREDGTGVAVSPAALSLAQAGQVVGRALESADDEGVKRITTLVGLSPDQIWQTLLQEKENRIAALETQMDTMHQQIADMEARLIALEQK